MRRVRRAPPGALAQIGGDGDKPIEQRPQYIAIEAKLRDAERNLRLTQVSAPFAGVVTNVNAIDIGAYLAAGQQECDRPTAGVGQRIDFCSPPAA